MVKLDLEWRFQITVIEKEVVNSVKRRQMIKELPFVKSKVTEAVKKHVQGIEDGKSEDKSQELLARYDALLQSMNEDCKRYEAEGYNYSSGGSVPVSVHSIASRGNMTRVLKMVSREQRGSEEEKKKGEDEAGRGNLLALVVTSIREGGSA